MSGSDFYEWLFGAEKVWGLSRIAPQTRDVQNVCTVTVTKGSTVLKQRIEVDVPDFIRNPKCYVL